MADRRRRSQSFVYMLIAMGVMGPILAILALVFMWRFAGTTKQSIVVPFLAVYALMPWMMLPMYRMRVRDAETDLQDLDFQIDLQQFEVNIREQRAEKILRINEFQLRRYYDMNLSQNFWVFTLGVFCIILGVTVIAVAFYLVLSIATDNQTKIVVAALGAIGALLTNYVAAIYLKMNASSAENLTSFHSRLVETHEILLANLLASRIDDTTKRSDTLANIATGIAIAVKK